MEVVKQEKDYKILKKRSGRYAVKGADGKWVNGTDKIKILVDSGLIKAAVPKKPEPEAPAAEPEAAAEQAEATEAPATEEA